MIGVNELGDVVLDHAGGYIRFLLVRPQSVAVQSARGHFRGNEESR